MAIHRFIGDREAPIGLAAIRGRRPSLGSGKIPEELAAIPRMRTICTTTSSNVKPTVEVESVAGLGRQLWKIQVPIGEDLRGARPGLSLERHPSDRYLEEVKQDVPFQSHRPDWIDAFPVPRLVLDRAARIACQPPEFQVGYVKELSADYTGERHIVTVGRDPDGNYRWEERPGPEPDEGQCNLPPFRVVLAPPEDVPPGPAGSQAEQQ